MHDMVLKLDEMGRPAWLGLMVVSFILFWPLGLAVLAFLLWSGRMGHGWSCRSHGASHGEGRRRWQRFADSWERRSDGSRPSYASSGNQAFDAYREETLKRLEDEQTEFRAFLERLRLAKDRSEFDQFMTERRTRPSERPEGESPAPQS